MPEEKNNDCYFYFYSTCTKGDNCPYRHCEAALGTETVCSSWREGRCFRTNCKFRHMEVRMNRSSKACFWETQPSGCCKPHCVFFHQKSRSNVNFNPENKRLILPVSSNSTQTNSASKDGDANDKSRNISASSMDNYSNHSEDVDMSPHPVEPIVVSFDEGEESDSESVSSTPIKSTSYDKYNSAPAKRSLTKDLSDGTENFGIKTLEQIRMEKIHKESEHFYKSDDPTCTEIPNISPVVNRNTSFGDKIFTYSAYDAPVIDSIQMSNITYKSESYPPASEFISVAERATDKSPIRESSLLAPETESDLRSRLLKRKASPSYKDPNPVHHKKVSTGRQSKEKEDGSLNFKVKTLDEIRKEKERKLGTTQEKKHIGHKDVDSAPGSNSSSTRLSSTGSNSVRLSTNTTAGRAVGRIRIRHPNKPVMNSSTAQGQRAGESMKTEARPQVVLHEVQNISEEQAKTDTIKIRRKETDNVPAGRTSKILLSGTSSAFSSTNGLSHTSNETTNTSVNGDGQRKKLRRPIIRRNMSSEPPSSISKSVNPMESLNKNYVTRPIIRRNLVSPPSTTSTLTTTSAASNIINTTRPFIRTSLVSSPSVTVDPSTTPESSSKSDDIRPIIRRTLVSPSSASSPKPSTTPESNNNKKGDTRPILRRSLVSCPLTISKPNSTVSDNKKNSSVVCVIKDSSLPSESKKPLSIRKTSPVKMDAPLKIKDSFTLEKFSDKSKSLRSTSVDEFESFMKETDLTLDDDVEAVKDTDLLMLEIEELLDS